MVDILKETAPEDKLKKVPLPPLKAAPTGHIAPPIEDKPEEGDDRNHWAKNFGNSLEYDPPSLLDHVRGYKQIQTTILLFLLTERAAAKVTPKVLEEVENRLRRIHLNGNGHPTQTSFFKLLDAS